MPRGGENLSSNPAENVNANEAPVNTGETVDQLPRETEEERGEKSLGNYNKFKHMDYEEFMAVDLTQLSREELLQYKAVNDAEMARLDTEIATSREKLGLEPDLSGFDKIVADNPDLSLENPETPESEQAQFTVHGVPMNGRGLAQMIAHQAFDAQSGPFVEPEQEPEPEQEQEQEAAPIEGTLETVETDAPAETIELTPDQVEAVKEAEQNPTIRSFLSSKAKKALAIALSVIAAIGIAGAVVFGATHNNEDANAANDTPQDPTAEQVQQQSGEQQEAKHGIKDGYREKGMWASPNKAGAYDFAAAGEVAEVCNGNEAEMLIYTSDNQSESLADYYAHMPDQLRPDSLKGITSITEMEKHLNSLSDDDYDSVFAQFAQVHRSSSTTYEPIIINGTCHNAYMRDAGALTHESMELVDCTTNENGTIATKVTYHDANGNELGFMLVKTGTCMQAVDLIGTNDTLYTGMPTVDETTINTPPAQTQDHDKDKPKLSKEKTPTPDPTPNPEPDTPTPDPTPTPAPDMPDQPETPETPEAPEAPETPDQPDEPEQPDQPDTPDEPETPDTPDEPETPDTPDQPDQPDQPETPDTPDDPDPTPHTPKNEQAELDHAGDRVDQRELDENVTPPTTLEQDQANFEDMERQRQEDAERATEAERVAAEQAERERQAAEQAEQRRQAEEEAARQRSAEEATAEAARQAAADEAAARANAEAAERQRQAAEAEQAAAAEQAAREQAQQEADAADAANQAEANANDGISASERANLFNNGDF